MKNSIKVLGFIAMIAVISVGAFAQQYEDGGNFQVARQGNGIKITGYVGTNMVVNIPPTIQGLPVTVIGEYAFEARGFTSITMPDSVTIIEEGAFSSTWITSITIPANVTTIGRQAFASCMNLTSIIIPRNVTTIGDLAFSNCEGITSVTIAGAPSIGSQAFRTCTSLTSVTFQSNINFGKFPTNAFRGDLQAKYFATNAALGTVGTYTTTLPVSATGAVWTKQ